MDIVLSAVSDQPLYRQIYEQICAQIVRGDLKSGDCLPPIRMVAKELRISVITVKKAWEALEHAGFIDTITGKGCFVSPLPGSCLGDKRAQLVAGRLKKELAYYRELGLSKKELLELVDQWYNE